MMIYTPIAQGITTNDDSEFAFTDLLTTGDNAYAMENYATAETAQKPIPTPRAALPWLWRRITPPPVRASSGSTARTCWKATSTRPSPAATPNSWAALSTG